MLDDLRKGAFDDADREATTAEDFTSIPQEKAKRKFLGMTAVERMFLIIFLFINVLVIGAAILLITGRLVL
jgi:cell division protein FtsL